MLSKCSSTKPLYKLQQSLDYIKHKEKLKQIISKTPRSKADKSLEIRPWKKQGLKNQMQKTGKIIDEENQKLLAKLMKISTRNSCLVRDGLRPRQNYFRKNWLRSIKKENQELGQKLMHLRSSLQYKGFTKSIDDYQKIKRSMRVNRRPKLPHLTLMHNHSGSLKDMLKNDLQKTSKDSRQIHTEVQIPGEGGQVEAEK